MKNPEIKLIIFDLGDVLVNINELDGYQRLENLVHDPESGNIVSPEVMAGYLFSPTETGENFNYRYQIGQESTDDYLERLSKRAGPFVAREQLYDAVTNIFTPLTERIALFNGLIQQGNPKIVMLSDTCEKDICLIEEKFPEIFVNLPKEDRYYSCRTGYLKKLGPEAYADVANKTGVDPKHILMIDDRIQNKPGADQAGLNFMLTLKNENLAERLIKEWNVNILSLPQYQMQTQSKFKPL